MLVGNHGNRNKLTNNIMNIKRIVFLAVITCFACGCYEDYVRDYDYDAVAIAYQYDLRSFVVGEGMEFKIGAMLGGVLSNDRNRKVDIVIDDELVNGDLSSYVSSETSFTAFDVMSGASNAGTVSNKYVTDAVNAAVTANGISSLVPLPSDLYSVEPLNMVIKKGKHTATAVVSVDSAAFLSTPNIGHLPHYAIGYRIVSADADKVINEKSFGVIALRIESRLFGNWYHGGVSKVLNASGEEISNNTYYTRIPAADASSYVYSLTTTGPFSVSTNWFHNSDGIMNITIGDGGTITVSDPESRITDLGSSWNEDILLQNRKIYMNYQYPDGDGNTVVVTDTLTFRNRILDGINEYQDNNPEHYK